MKVKEDRTSIQTNLWKDTKHGGMIFIDKTASSSPDAHSVMKPFEFLCSSPPGHAVDFRIPKATITEQQFKQALVHIRKDAALHYELGLLRRCCERLTSRVSSLESELFEPSSCVVIETFYDEPYDVLRPFSVSLWQSGDTFVASFVDANISASGDYRAQALENLKDSLLDSLEMLGALTPEQLGPGPSRQLVVLRSVIGRK